MNKNMIIFEISSFNIKKSELHKLIKKLLHKLKSKNFSNLKKHE
jgi:hypothetical protein